MTTEPANPAAAGRDRLRAGHADREQVIETLKMAFVYGRLTKSEFDTRAGQALTARTFADLAALTTDIPSSAPGLARPLALARRRPLARASAKSGLCLVIAVGAVWIGALLPTTPGSDPGALFLAVALAAVITAFGVLANGVATSLERRVAPRQLPPGRA